MLKVNVGRGEIMENAKAVCDGGDLDCGSGLLLIIKKAMDPLLGGEILEVRSRERPLLMIYLLGVEWSIMNFLDHSLEIIQLDIL